MDVRNNVWKGMGYELPQKASAPQDLIDAQIQAYVEYRGNFDAITMMPIEAWWNHINPYLATNLEPEIREALSRLYLGASLLAAGTRVWGLHFRERSDGSLLFLRLGLAQTILASWERCLDLAWRCVSLLNASNVHPGGTHIQGYVKSRTGLNDWLEGVSSEQDTALSSDGASFRAIREAGMLLHGDVARGPYPPGLDNLFFGHRDRGGRSVSYDALRDGRDAFAHAKELSGVVLETLDPGQLLEAHCTFFGTLMRLLLATEEGLFLMDNSWDDCARRRLKPG